jgi:DnaJ-class molecular chaperone
MVRQFDAADRLCPACAGMGRVDLMDGSGAVTCPRCEGRGMIQSQAAAAAEQE